MTKYVEWDEPLWDNGATHLHGIIRAKLEDVVAYRRKLEPRYESDQDALDDFLVVHWARIVEYD